MLRTGVSALGLHIRVAMKASAASLLVAAVLAHAAAGVVGGFAENFEGWTNRSGIYTRQVLNVPSFPPFRFSTFFPIDLLLWPPPFENHRVLLRVAD